MPADGVPAREREAIADEVETIVFAFDKSDSRREDILALARRIRALAVPAGRGSEVNEGKCCDACYRGCLDTEAAQVAGSCYDPACACHTPRPAPDDQLLARRVREFLDYVGRVKSLHRGVVLNYCNDMRAALGRGREGAV